MLRALIDAVIALPDDLRGEVARWLVSGSPKPNGQDPYPPVLTPAPPALERWSVPLCSLAVMLGHIYPAWFGFRGVRTETTLDSSS